MKILVCVKQVPDQDSNFTIDDEGLWIASNPDRSYKMNRFDEYALEEALKIKRNNAGVDVDVITAGTDKAREVIKRSFGLGADKGIHIATNETGYIDPFKTAELIARQIQNEDYDLILTGIMSEDMMQAQTGQMIAEFLDLPCGTGIISLSVDSQTRSITAEREVDGGQREKIQIKLPALLTIQAGINTPEYPTLSNILKADLKEIITVKASFCEEKQTIASMDFPAKIRSGIHLKGSAKEKVTQLYNILNEKNVLKK